MSEHQSAATKQTALINTQLQELIAAGRDAVGRGLVLASAGNLSIRTGENTFAVTASGTWLDRLTPADFITLTLDGAEDGTPNPALQVTAPAPARKPSSEWRLHHRAYLARPDVNCVIHLHPRTAVVMASVGTPIRLLTLDHAYYLGSIGIVPFYHNGTTELADTAAAALQEHNAVIMQHHGCSVVADTVEMAYRRALNLEDAAQATLLALQLGDTETVFPDLSGAHHA